MTTDPRWRLLQEARQLIADRLAEHGVRGVEYVAAFPQNETWVWLGTKTEAQRDALLAHQDPKVDTIRQILSSLGYPTNNLTHVHSTSSVSADS